jgi:hypothetical protein
MVDQADTKPALLMRTARENPASYFEKIREAGHSLLHHEIRSLFAVTAQFAKANWGKQQFAQAVCPGAVCPGAVSADLLRFLHKVLMR